MNLHLSLLTNTMIYLESPVYCKSSFNTIETYICITSMMMLEITMEVSVNIDLPLKGRAQAWLGHSTFLALLDTFGKLLESFTFRHWETLFIWTLG